MGWWPVLADLSSPDISSTERETENWELKNRKNQGFGIKKVVKTGNIEKKRPVAGGIHYVGYLSMQKVKHEISSVVWSWPHKMVCNWTMKCSVYYNVRNHFTDTLISLDSILPLHVSEHYYEEFAEVNEWTLYNDFTDRKPWKMMLSIWAASWQNQQMACAPSEDSDQPGHLPSLIRVFAVHLMGS